jgi:DDE family transposase
LKVAEITGPGLFYRLREAEGWLERVLAQTLQSEVRNGPSGLPLRIVDATVIVGPGATGTEWRAHVLINPATGGFQSVELTDNRGGEGYALHPIVAGEVVLGDRAYATARGIYVVSEAKAHVVARLNPHTLRICGLNRKRIFILKEERKIPKTGAIPPAKRSKTHKSWSLSKAVAWVPARIVAARTRERKVIWILTTLPREQVTPLRIMELYRLRWQIELLFKRLKSLLHLDTLPSRQGPTARSWILARLLAAALAQKLVRPSGPFSPWGYELREERLHT